MFADVAFKPQLRARSVAQAWCLRLLLPQAPACLPAKSRWLHSLGCRAGPCGHLGRDAVQPLNIVISYQDAPWSGRGFMKATARLLAYCCPLHIVTSYKDVIWSGGGFREARARLLAYHSPLHIQR
eukprot:364350-Chlamydomonas_euryale.AAC.5